MPMAKPLRTDTKIGTHIGSIICWLSWLWISSSVENIFINRCWLSVSLFKVLQIRFIWKSQNYTSRNISYIIYGYHIRHTLSSYPINKNWTFPICSKIFFHFSYSGQINSIRGPPILVRILVNFFSPRAQDSWWNQNHLGKQPICPKGEIALFLVFELWKPITFEQMTLDLIRFLLKHLTFRDWDTSH